MPMTMTPDSPRALVIRTAGTNCDHELVRAFEQAGAAPETVHVETLVREPDRLESFDLIGFPGGFSYGDDIASGRVLAAKLRDRLYPPLREAARRGVPMIGVCNGFQVLVQLGLLPGTTRERWPDEEPPEPTLALTDNDTAEFCDRWVGVAAEPASVCVWTRDLWAPGEGAADALRLPIANGEGRLVARPGVIPALEAAGQVALRYNEPVNGSEGQIAGVCDPSGLIFGLMPHPERYTDWAQHPYRTRLPGEMQNYEPPGLRFFQNAVAAVTGQGAASRT